MADCACVVFCFLCEFRCGSVVEGAGCRGVRDPMNGCAVFCDVCCRIC